MDQLPVELVQHLCLYLSAGYDRLQLSLVNSFMRNSLIPVLHRDLELFFHLYRKLGQLPPARPEATASLIALLLSPRLQQHVKTFTIYTNENDHEAGWEAETMSFEHKLCRQILPGLVKRLAVAEGYSGIARTLSLLHTVPSLERITLRADIKFKENGGGLMEESGKEDIGIPCEGRECYRNLNTSYDLCPECKTPVNHISGALSFFECLIEGFGVVSHNLGKEPLQAAKYVEWRRTLSKAGSRAT